MSGVSHHDEEIARRHGVVLIKLKNGRGFPGPKLAAICLWTGNKIRVGHESWVRSQLEVHGIRIEECVNGVNDIGLE